MYTGTDRNIQFTAGLLQAALATRNVEAIVSPVFDGPQLQTYAINLALGVKPEIVEGLAGALAITAGAGSCRVARDQGRLLVEIPKPPKDRKILTANRLLRIKNESTWCVPLGVGTTGQVVWYDLADERMCHVLLGGTTRSGKTNLLRWMLFRLLLQNPARDLQLLLLDPKGSELQPFAHVRHLLHPPEHDVAEIVKSLMWVDRTMKERAIAGIRRPCILVVIDEIRNLVRSNRQVTGLVNSIAEMSAGEGIHLLCTTQQPGAKALGEAIANFPCRMLGRVSSRTLEYGAAGRARSQAGELLGRGDILRITDTITRFQAPLVDLELLECLPQETTTRHLDLSAFDPDQEPVGDVDPRGGWQRKPIDIEAIQAAVEDGMTAAALGRTFSINFHRAQRLVEQFGGSNGH